MGWITSVVVIAALIALSYVLRDVPDQASVPHAAYQGLHRTLWGLCVAWVILACEEGYGGECTTGPWYRDKTISQAHHENKKSFKTLHVVRLCKSSA